MPSHPQGRLAKIKEALTGWWSRYDLYLLAVFGLLGTGALLIGAGALFSWPLMVGLLVSVGLPLLTLEITLTAAGCLLVLGPIAYGIKYLLRKSAHDDFIKMEQRVQPSWFERLKAMNKWLLAGLVMLAVISSAGLALGIGLLCGWAALTALVPAAVSALILGIGLTAAGAVILSGVAAYSVYRLRRKETSTSTTAVVDVPKTGMIDSIVKAVNNNLSRISTRASLLLTAQPAQVIDIELNPPEINSRDHVRPEERLGNGAFGEVFKGTYNKKEYRNIPLAIKQLTALEEEAEQRFKTEAITMKALKHDNIVKVYGYIINKSPYWIIMEYMQNGSLADHLYPKAEKQPFDPNLQLSIAKDMLRGVAYLHKNKIIHRDIKSMNILLDKDYRAKVADFGLAKSQEATKAATLANGITGNKIVGTLLWLAPEILDDNLYVNGKAQYTRKSDIYACGLVIWELVTQRYPFGGHQFRFLNYIHANKRDVIPATTQPKLSTLIKWCWNQDKAQRPTAKAALRYLSNNP